MLLMKIKIIVILLIHHDKWVRKSESYQFNSYQSYIAYTLLLKKSSSWLSTFFYLSSALDKNNLLKKSIPSLLKSAKSENSKISDSAY